MDDPLVKNYVEYDSAPENPWRVDLWIDLSRRFDIQESDMVLFHQSLAGQGRCWDVIRKMYGVNPLFSMGPADILDVEDIKDVAKGLGLVVKTIEKDLDLAKEIWIRAKAGAEYGALMKTEDDSISNELSDSLDEFDKEEAEKKESESKLDLGLEINIDEDKVEELLRYVNCEYLTDSRQRLKIADRVMHLASHLRQKNSRVRATSLIQMEVSLDMYNGMRVEYLMEIQNLRENKDDRGRLAKIEKAEERIQSIDKTIKTLYDQYSKELTELGVDELDMTKKKEVFTQSVSYLFSRMHEYYEDPDKKLFDGVFSAAEVVWMMTPLKNREAQYRPDVVMRAKEALDPENYFDKDYKPTVIGRQACRILQDIVKKFGLASEVDEIEGIDDVKSVDDEEDLVTSSPLEADLPTDVIPQAMHSPVVSVVDDEGVGSIS